VLVRFQNYTMSDDDEYYYEDEDEPDEEQVKFNREG